LLSLFLATAALAITGSAQTPTHVVISQVYGGGGNSGATYTNDFIEIFNPTTAPQTLTGYSVQYASATGTTYQVTQLPATVVLQPGQYFLVQEAQGAGGTTALPTPDATGTLAMSATAGKVALVNSTTALSGASGCPTAAQGVVDYVGFGSTANCYLGAGPTATLANATAAVRTNVCVDNQSNAVDFSAAAASPHNTSSMLAPCNPVGPGAIAGAGLATPASVNQYGATLLTVTVIPGTNPASSGIAVSADLSGIGGSSTQPFFDNGTNGDVTAGDNVFSYSTTPSLAGTFSLPVVITDSQTRSAQTTIALTVVIPPPTVSIQQIQSAKPSPYVGQSITTSGIVIGVKSNGFYLEAKDASTTASTPQGVMIYTGSTAKPSYIALGNEVQVSGRVSTYPTTGLTPGTEIDTPTFTLLSTGNALPPAVTITQAMDSPSGGVYQFARLEGMRVAIDSLTTTSGTDASLTESTETNTSNGRFYGVVTGVPRPFREPGVSVMDTTFGALPAGIPLWDSNPELLYIDSKTFGGAAIDLTSNTTVTGLAGVMDFSFGTPEIILDAANHPTVTGGMVAQPVPVKGASEFTIASMNLERFYNDVSDQDNPGSTAVVVSTAAYQRRLNKASLAIRNVLNIPDVIGVQEVENLAVLTDLATKVSADAVAAGQADPLYVPYLFLANDISAINTGLLVKSTKVNTVRVEQFGLNTTFTNSNGGQSTLNDRTPLVAHLGIKRGGTAADYPLTMIVVHQRSLINVNDPTSTGATVRLKREAQAEFLANLIQGYQTAGEHVVAVGDYNGFEFSDGYVDVLGVTRGDPVPASQVVTPPVAGLANPPLVDLVTLLPADQRQSYVEVGSAQVLDHVVVTSDLVPINTRLVYAHYDADFPLVYLNDASRPERVSDHDAPVAYFSIPPVQGTIQITTTATIAKLSDGSYQATVTVRNSGTGTAQNVTLTGAVIGSTSGSPLPYALGDIQPGATATATILYPPLSGNPAAIPAQRYTGTYTGGTFVATIRAVPVSN
jgi:predicted extracellular nuclease